MAITINNVSINNQLTIINDAGINSNNPNNGPKAYSGDTEADVIIDGVGYFNINASDIIPANVHALQFSVGNGTGWVEFDGNTQNQDIASSSDLPNWANTMVKRWNGEKVYKETYNSVYANLTANLDQSSVTFETDIANAQTNATAQATTAKNNILSA